MNIKSTGIPLAADGRLTEILLSQYMELPDRADKKSPDLRNDDNLVCLR